jgi:hypothetical protein
VAGLAPEWVVVETFLGGKEFTRIGLSFADTVAEAEVVEAVEHAGGEKDQHVGGLGDGAESVRWIRPTGAALSSR